MRVASSAARSRSRLHRLLPGPNQASLAIRMSVFIPRPQYQRHRAENFLVVGAHAGANVVEQRRGVEGAGAVQRGAASKGRTGGNRLLHLQVQFVAQVGAGHRCQRGGVVKRIAAA